MQFRGAGHATTTPEILAAIAGADAVIIGPSNPIISIGPMLAVGDLHQALRETAAPVVAVSPLVEGEVVKGPTAGFLRWRGVDSSVEGVAAVYEGVIDGLVADQRVERAARAGDRRDDEGRGGQAPAGCGEPQLCPGTGRTLRRS